MISSLLFCSILTCFPSPSAEHIACGAGSKNSACEKSHVVVQQANQYIDRNDTTLVIKGEAYNFTGNLRYFMLDDNAVIKTGPIDLMDTNTSGEVEYAVREGFADTSFSNPIGAVVGGGFTDPTFVAFRFTKTDVQRVSPETINNADNVQSTDSAAVNGNENAVTAFDPLQIIEQAIDNEVLLDVPFTPQAPDANRVHPYDEACEESSLLMVDRYYENKGITQEEALTTIPDFVEWHLDQGIGVDAGTYDMLEMAAEYLGRDGIVYDGEAVTTKNMQRLLTAGYPIVLPVAGRLLGNPYYVGSGPPYHVIVLIGYNDEGFISHDPGTRRGDNFVYSYDTVEEATHDRNGSKETILSGPKRFLVLEK